ncbi:MAG: hypothetical protein V4760_08050, partial [Bdellovibrionota bacterium]
ILSVATTYEQAEAALKLGFALTSSQESQAGPVLSGLRRVSEQNFERLWVIAEKDGQLEQLRGLIKGTNSIWVYKARMVERVRTAAELQWLHAHLPGEITSGSEVLRWVSANPVRLMQLKPKPTDVEVHRYFDMIQTSERAAWAE